MNKTSLPSADPKVSMCSTAEITGLSFSCSLIPRDLAMVTHNLKYMDYQSNLEITLTLTLTLTIQSNAIQSNPNQTKPIHISKCQAV